MALAASTLSALLVHPAQAKEGDTFRPFVSYAYVYDSNLLRLDTGEFDDLQRSDRYSVLSAGLNVDWKPGRQRIQASASKNLVRFSRYASLDYDGSDYQLRWNWRLGNHWSGQLGASRDVTQTNFSDFQSFDFSGTPVFLAVRYNAP